MRADLSRKKLKSNFLKVFIVMQVILIIVGSLIIYDIYENIKKQRLLDERQHWENFQRIEEEYERRYNLIIGDLLCLSKGESLKAYLAVQNEARYATLLREWKNFFDYHAIYDQIRYLDEKGKEVVRINYKDGKGHVILPEQLQDKGGRYYFVEAMSREQDEVYVSRIDLNIENNQIELPLKPMTRFATPVYDEEGNNRGVVIFNYYAQRFLDQLYVLQEMFKADLQVLNAEGYWIYHSEAPEKCWGFMYGDLERKLSRTMPNLMRKIQNSEAEPGTYYIKNQGVYYYKKLMIHDDKAVLTPNQDKYLILLSHLPTTINTYKDESCFKSAFYSFIHDYKSEIGIIWLTSGIGAWIIAYGLTLKREQKVLKNTLDNYYKVVLEIVKFMESDESFEESLTNHDFDDIQEVAEKLARQLGLKEEKIEAIRKYAAIHDIGKIGIDRAILQKPGKLTEEEMTHMKQHVTIGAKLIEKVMGIDEIVANNIVKYHHEAWDGTGYTMRMKEEEIPVEARIIAIVDIYDALRSTRPYKQPFSHEEAMEILEKMKGSKLDPRVVEAFVVLSPMIKKLYAEDC